MSFWAESPGPHWSDWLKTKFLKQPIPVASPIRRTQVPLTEETKYKNIGELQPRDCEALTVFLQTHFKITKKSQCRITEKQIRESMANGWIWGIMKSGLDPRGIILGSIVSRPLGDCAFLFNEGRHSPLRRSFAKNTGYIDFFCVHPDFQKGKVGSALLQWIDSKTSMVGRHIHFFQKELTPLVRLPPIWVGQYIVRENIRYVPTSSITIVSGTELATIIEKPGLQITFPSYVGEATKLYKYTSELFLFYVAITDTYHTTTKGGKIGEVLWTEFVPKTKQQFYKIENSAMEKIVEASGYSVLLMDSTLPHQQFVGWKTDSTYYIYAYNLNPRRFFTVRPAFWL